jgi:hypothetical protein
MLLRSLVRCIWVLAEQMMSIHRDNVMSATGSDCTSRLFVVPVNDTNKRSCWLLGIGAFGGDDDDFVASFMSMDPPSPMDEPVMPVPEPEPAVLAPAPVAVALHIDVEAASSVAAPLTMPVVVASSPKHQAVSVAMDLSPSVVATPRKRKEPVAAPVAVAPVPPSPRKKINMAPPARSPFLESFAAMMQEFRPVTQKTRDTIAFVDSIQAAAAAAGVKVTFSPADD